MVKENITTRIEPEIRAIAKRHCFALCDCLAFGVLFKEAEIEGLGYPANLLSIRIETMAARLEEALRRIEELESPKSSAEKIYPEGSYDN